MHPLNRLISFACLYMCAGLTSVAGCETHSGDYDVYEAPTNTREPWDNCIERDTCEIEDQKFYYLKISDTSAGEGTSNPGADIDAVSLTKESGAVHFVANVLDYKPREGVDIWPESSLIDNILGEPTAFAAEGEDFNTVTSASKCSLAAEHYLGLGGPGGYVVIDFGNNDIANGDMITVYEIGNCMGNVGSAGVTDAVEVQISVGKTIDEDWLTILRFASGPVMSGEVSGLPKIPVQ